VDAASVVHAATTIAIEHMIAGPRSRIVGG
jgi:hypothetical protein